ncbi:putative phage portal protein [Wolbachia endosymbiont of Culex quinquefasciatus JHB]|uniref:phage portal protein n=1 Tax=Wolbachia endosymbiont of Culex quinquefasciatus TaxID=263437 RepID=UPI0001848F12|nr:phage portal protein [Wolbachia endosymbiont of Culex quinquefasciatus]EEB56093.1 putative phage portal protein [Wolbachia endosymbiont of Culex quinquefasciatus JHB]
MKITQTEWAREIGVSKQYVCYLVKKGIVELEDGLIDREQANRAIETIRDPSQPLRRKNYSESGEKLSTMLLKTRIKNEMERGKLLEAKAKAEIGELVAVEEVKSEAFNVARIEFNKLGQREAYYLFKEHPGENTFGESVRVPANDVLHIYKPLRPGQIRGEPWLSNVLLKLYELDQYDDAELVRKKTAAMFAGFITRLDPEANIMGEGEASEQGVALSGLEPGTMQLLDPGEDIKFSEPSDVGGSYEAFMRQQLRAIAIGTGITYEQLTGDLTGVNYSSIRAGLIEFRRRCAMLQHNIMVFQFCRPVWNRWLELAVLCGELRIDEKVAKAAKEEVKWIPQGFDWVDPLKDQQAQQMAVRNGFKSRSEVVSEMGYDVEEIDQEIAEDQKRADSLNLFFDSDVRTQTK